MATNDQAIKFGYPMKEHFLFDSKWKNLNHGSFGAHPKSVKNALRGYQDLTDMAPDRFLFYQRVDFLDEARKQVAELINADIDECVFVQNATTGVNIAMRNLTWQDKDAVIYFATTYGSCQKTLASIQETNPRVHLQRIERKLPCSHAELCTEFSQTISRLLYDGYRPKVALFDTISSLPGVRYPFERLIKICKEYNILSVVDGAHSVGQIPLDMAVLQPDFFTSNCHKWLYTPRGCAVLYVAKRNQHLVRTTLPTSHGYKPVKPIPGSDIHLPPSGKTDFVNLFDFVATVDSGPYYCVPAALDFRRRYCNGEQAIYDYIRDTAQQGADIVAGLLGTKVMDDRTSRGSDYIGTLRDCAMANVMLPINIKGSPAAAEKGDTDWLSVDLESIAKVTVWMQKILINDFDTHLQIFVYANRVWLRVSGQIYLEASDFEWAAAAVKQVLLRVRDGEALRTADKTKVKSPGLTNMEIEALGAGLATQTHIS